jgi:hypothetical protein
MTSLLPARVTIPESVLFQELEGESVLLNLADDRYYGLDDVGTRMWQLLAEDGEVATVVKRLQAEYGGEVDEATLRRDLGALIERLAGAGLVTVVAAGT